MSLPLPANNSPAASLADRLLTAGIRRAAFFGHHTPAFLQQLTSEAEARGTMVLSCQAQDASLDAIRTLIADSAGEHRDCLLVLDDVDRLAATSAFTAALRTTLDMAAGHVHIVFLGSTREGIDKFFADPVLPFFQFAVVLPLESMKSR